MNKRTDYINRVKAGNVLKAFMAVMEDNGELVFEYSENKYEIHCSVYDSGMRTYSIGEHDQLFGNRMNIDLNKSSKVALHCYTYDLFSTKTTANLSFEKIKLVKV